MIPTYPYGREWPSSEGAHTATVGVVMRTQGRPLLLPRALDSVIGQTFDDWHLVVVNHGGDSDVVESCVDRVVGSARGKIEVLHLDAGGGMERASNAGLDRLDTEFFAIHDDDDTWKDEFLERTVTFLQEPANSNYGAVVTHAIKRWEQIREGVVETVEDESLNADESFVDIQQLFGWNRIFTINTLFRSALRDVVGPYNEQLSVVGDWEFHMRVAAVTEIGLIPEVLARYHLRHLGGEAEYENTVVAGWTFHREMDARLRGALLRRYLEADPSRLGVVVAMAHDAEIARKTSGQIEELVRLIDWRTHHTGNRINDMHDRVLNELHDRIASLEVALHNLDARIGRVQEDTGRIRQAIALLGLPARPFRRARHRWRSRRPTTPPDPT